MAGPDPYWYPSGISRGEELVKQPTDDTDPGNDPSWVSGPVMDMSMNWPVIDCVVGGSNYLRRNAAFYLPQEPKEDEDAWRRRVSHAVMSPFTVRIAEQAAGLILRKKITLEPKDEDGVVDPYWEEFFEDVDGYGTSLDTFARRVAISSILYGHAGILVDYSGTEVAPNLAVERALGMRPYFSSVDAKSILGWRFESDQRLSPIGMIRILEYVQEPYGLYGEREVMQVRILMPGAWQVMRQDADGGWYVHQEGTTSVSGIPFCLTYSQKIAELVSKPPLLEIAQINILQSQRQADLQHALHVSALPILVLQGFDDSESTIGLSANSAILLPTDGSASYVEPASSAFDAQQSFIKELEQQMGSLGISTLFAQKMGAETAESKRLSRTDSDSLLSVVSKDLERCLQEAMDRAGEFIGMDAPKVVLDRDFDTQVLDGPQVQQYMQLWMNGAITHETLLDALRRGEVLPNINVEEEVELTEQEKLANMDMAMAGNNIASSDESEEEPSGEETSEIRAEVERRLRRLASDQNGESDS